MSNIKKIIKKSFISIASFLIVMSGLAISSHALTGVTNSERPSDWYLANPVTNEKGGHEGYLLVNGEPVFCTDFYTKFHRNKVVTAGTPADIGISDEKAKRLSLIAYYGTKVDGRKTKDWYAITQGLLWREIHENNTLDYVSCPTAPDYATTKKCWDAILADVNQYYVMPSFTTATHEIDMDKTVELNDTNNVLSNMVVQSSGGLDVSISGNKLVIKGNANVTENTKIVLRKNIAASETGTSVVYTSSDCQSLGSFKIYDPAQVAFNVKVNKYGNFELVKYNDDKSATIPNTSYHVTGPNGFDKTVTTDENGKISLQRIPVGDYKCVETQAGDGYLINVSEIGFTVKVNETTQVDPTNAEPIGTIELTKNIDLSKTNNLKGDAYIKGNTYGLYASSIIYNKAGTKKFYDKDQLVSSKQTDDNGNIVWGDLPLGDYYIKETKSNSTLVLDSTRIDVSLKYQGQTVKVVTEKKNTSDRVNMQKIQVFKSGEGEGVSGVVKGLQGAEFTFKLKSEVDHVGWDNAVAYSTITTDENGKANTDYLPYGTYIVKETKTPKDFITAPDFTLSVTKDYSEYKDVEQVKKVNVNNAPFKTQLKLVKVDEDTGDKITLNSASFKIKDSKGNYIVQKVGGVKYDTFTTNSKNNTIVLQGKDGEVVLPLMLGAGEYTIEEVKTPNGFLTSEPLKFTITNQYDYDIDDDEDPILTITIKNKQPKGKILLKKNDKVTAAPLENVEYELKAAEDIYNAIDGSLRYKKGNTVSTGKTDAKGEIIIDNLYMGKYQLKETLTNQGYVLSDDVHDIEFTQKDLTTKIYETSINVTNIAPKGEIHLFKSDKDSGESLSGVTFELTAAEDIYSLDGRHALIYKKGSTVSKDISENGLYVTNELGEIHIGDLALGKYQLKEVKTLDGYYSNDTVYDIDLSYDHSEKVLYTKDLDITNTQTKIEIMKIDQVDKGVVGAKLEILDKDNKVIDSWISDGKAHIINGKLLENETYTLHEVSSPNEYYEMAKDIPFTVNKKDEVIKLKMTDEKYDDVEITKYDATSMKELPGAHLELRDEQGNLIEEWVSTEEQHSVKLKVASTYTLKETIAPDGYEVAETVTFKVDDNGEVVQKVVMLDELLPVVKKVETGDSTQILLYMALGTLSVAIMAYYVIKRRRKE